MKLCRHCGSSTGCHMQRVADLIIHSKNPLNAETRLDRLRASFITAQSDFYIRSHGDIPHIEAASHRVQVDGLVRSPLSLSVAELRSMFPPASVTAVMQCAGNRRADLQLVRPTGGDPWAAGAIGNAVWTGVKLHDVLEAAGAHSDEGLHVALTACDEVELPAEGHFRYGVSIPMTKARSPDVLLAFAMNGEALMPEHGYPVRLVVPGYAGVRSPKWLAGITVQDKPSTNHMQQRDYKLLPPDVSDENLDWDRGIPINDMPLNAAICSPQAFAELPAGKVMVAGYAIANTRDVTRVDVSADGGREWRQAELHHDRSAPWSWAFWDAALQLAVGEHELVVRAWDSAGQTQPAMPDDVWNFKGYLSAAWHRVRVRCV